MVGEMSDYIITTIYRHPGKTKGIVHTYGPYTREAALRERKAILKEYADRTKEGYRFDVHATKLIKDTDSW
jgi:uncharacterized protein YwgA